MENSKTINPPYIGVPSLQKLFNLLGTRNFSQLNVGDLESRGFSKSVAFQALQGLKFLEILDSEGKTTEKAKILALQGTGKKEQLETLVKSAYSKLFETANNAESLSKAELHDEFMAVYNLSSRLAKSAAPAFLWLCSTAGLNVSEIIEVKERRTIDKKKSDKAEVKKDSYKSKDAHTSPINSPQEVTGSQNHIDLNIAKSGIRLIIPKTPDIEDAVAGGELGEIRTAITTFAKKYDLLKESLSEIDSSDS